MTQQLSLPIEVANPDPGSRWVSVACDLTETTREFLIREANKFGQHEVCGFVTSGGTVIPVPNVHEESHKAFMMEPITMVNTITKHEVAALYHSHPSGRPWPSKVDTEQMAYLYQQGCPWDYYIVTRQDVYKFEFRDRDQTAQ